MERGPKRPSGGFTLVELAVVMAIIGLLIGGVLKGEELITNARVKRTISDVSGIKAAIQTFVDKYQQKPGDMATATGRLSDCTPAIACQNGDGNNIIAQNPIWSWMTSRGQINSEETQAWKHLALAELITGVDPTATQSDWGVSHPKSPWAGGYHFAYGDVSNTGAGGMDVEGNGQFVRLQPALRVNFAADSYSATGSGGQGALSPRIAAIIDRQIDDGLPGSGIVWGAELDNSSHPDCGAAPPHRYREQSNSMDCLLWVKIF